MDVKITDKKKNILMNRTEVTCEVQHDGEATPRREEIKKNVADQMNVKEDKVILVSINSKYGGGSNALLHVYSNDKDLKTYEKKHLFLRNNPVKKEAKEDGKEKEGSQSQGKESPKEEADE
jgi:ribosomal protein S24E